MSKLLRILAFIGGALGVIVEAIQEAGTISTSQAIMIGCVALMAYALKWPGDSTPAEVEERVDRAVRRSIMPPPSREALDFIDVPGGSHTLVPRARPLTQADLTGMQNTRIGAFPTCACPERYTPTLQGLCPVCGLQPRSEP